ncbi:MAG: leucyl aminopeptidase [Armatimonadetes bacterium]|nr:leucyl aminopeptidase [Armatimonadota bacterium]
MKLEIQTQALEQVRADALLVLVAEGNVLGALAGLNRLTGGSLAAALEYSGFAGRRDKTLSVYPSGKIGAPRVIVVGMGNPDSGPFSAEHNRLHAIRRAAAAGVREAQAQKVKHVGVLVPWGDPQIWKDARGAALQAVAEGAVLGAYRYTTYKSAETPGIEAVDVIIDRGARKSRDAAAAIERGRVVAEATCLTRDLVNGPPNEVNPVTLADLCRKMAKSHGLKFTVWGPEELEKQRMGAILGVGRGSRVPTQVIILEHRPARAAKTFAFCGKGVTFDSGGLSLKPADSMETMKGDMSGAAAVVGALQTAAALKVPHRVLGVIGAVENMTGGAALKPGEVLRARNGKTIEVRNTDAEGRLLLADILSWAAEQNPDMIIDLATLTGAARIAMGSHTAAVMGNDDAWIGAVIRAGAAAGERIWQLPLWEEFLDAMKGEITDLKNTGGRNGGAQKAAAFLGEFVGGRPWVHLDIAPVAYIEQSEGLAPHLPRGATGFGVRTLVNLLTE